ncbi:MAG: putative ABC transporter ATP-binding protein [Hyphomicrobiaceae bacterium hypho_1]
MRRKTTKDFDGIASDIIKMSDVSFGWPRTQNFRINIDNFSLKKGSKTLLVGPSGSGKSTFLSLLCGIIVPLKGNIDILNVNIVKLSNSARDKFRVENIGVIFQMFNLLPYGTVMDNVLLPLSFAQQRRERVGRTEEQAINEASSILNALGLDRVLFTGPASALSVGQQQRVAAARALIGTPPLVVADEPISALDYEHQKRFLDLLFHQIEKTSTTLLMVSHDRCIGSLFDDVLELGDVVTLRG